MQDEHELWWRLYLENATSARHHEQQPTAITSFFTALAAGILAVLGLDRCLDSSDLPLTALLLCVGILGALLSAKQYERFNLHLARSRQYRNALAEAFPGARILELKDAGEAENKTAFPWLSKTRMGVLWVGMHGLVALLGFLLASGILLKWFRCGTG